MSLQNRWEPRSSWQLQGQKVLSEGRVRRIHTQLQGQKMLSRVRRIHTHTLYFLPAFKDVSRNRYPFVILVPLFFFSVFSFLSLDTNRLRCEISFLPEPLRKPLYEPSCVNIEFYYNLKKYIHRDTVRIAQR